MYAVCYARKWNTEFGIIKKYVIAKELNVFNAFSAYDLARLHKALPLPEKEWNSITKNLQEKDWSLLGEDVRQILVEAIRSLGYDGFFNYECTERCPLLMDFGIRNNYEKSASFGIFDTSSLKEIEVLERKDFEKESKTFMKQHEDEIGYKIKHIPMLLEKGLSKEDVMSKIYDLCPTLTWEELQNNSEIIEESYRNEQIAENYREAVKRLYARFRLN